MADENDETTTDETAAEEEKASHGVTITGNTVSGGQEELAKEVATDTSLRENKIDKDDGWATKARKHERENKRLLKEREDLQKRLKEREDADKSESEKALEAAREEGRTSALTEAQKERRQDRLEVAATRLAAKGIAVGEGDDAKTLKFADPDDALVHVERAIRSGEVDEDDIYDKDNRVKAEGLTAALRDILDRKPHLVAKAAEAARVQGSSDAGRGQGGGKSLEEMSPDDHLKALQSRT